MILYQKRLSSQKDGRRFRAVDTTGNTVIAEIVAEAGTDFSGNEFWDRVNDLDW